MNEYMGKTIVSVAIALAMIIAIYVTKSANPLWAVFIIVLVWNR